ncbi:transcription-repair coupling factor [Nakamurella flavida]|uniref:Transcription-repair-coupling factor n=1 Tax=Nakamurella flavida TaxID=363630 RepID=A0A938YMB9_9ACTN|nr:transcription-repair coupling factor [Nakamurella flavida]MBM9477333.1 transcription-repair coupling factor [Nakamurella flavida]MDP9779789.1 transcription-repair coupling factor (superfamily II helicase) [Nakamurella flavida]
MSADTTTAGSLDGLLAAALTDPYFADLVGAAGRPTRRVVGPPAIRPFVCAALASAAPAGAGVPVLLVTATGREAEMAVAAIGDLLGDDRVCLFPSWETLPHERLSPRADTVGRRLATLRRLAHPERDPAGYPAVVVTTVRSLIQPMAPGLGEMTPVELRVGQEVDLSDLVEQLVGMAYGRVEMVEKRGEVAVRGGILDIFPPNAAHPVRVEFFGDEISDLRTFAVTDQRSLEAVDVVVAPPCREILLTPEVRERAEGLSTANTGDPTLSEMLAKLASGVPVEGMESLIPVLVTGRLTLLPELLARGTHVVLADPERVRTRAEDLVRTGNEFLAASWMAAATGGRAPIDLGSSAYRTLEDTFDVIRDAELPIWSVTPFDTGLPDAADDPGAAPAVLPATEYRGEFAAAVGDARAALAQSHPVVLVVAGAGTAQRAQERLAEAEVGASIAGEGSGELHTPLRSDVVTVACGRLEHGFTLTASGLTMLTEADLTGGRGAVDVAPARMPTRRRNAVDPVSLKPGDYVVHSQHGIGRYVDLVQRTSGGATREYLVVEYAPSKRNQPGDRLFVPTDSLDLLSRFVGGETPTLNKLGGSDWAKTKGRARKAVRQIAAKLVQLYAARASSPGHAFGPDTPWQRELEDAFPFTETADQLSAIDEVKADMERPVPMDRVISGDVGYGKTEIAVRAAFKAVQDGKQVVILVPTTLLAQQHLSTFTERMNGFPVVIRGLSRFTDDKQGKQTVEGLADGSVDIVIGTHRLLQSTIRYKDLGLVIVDEEQRFGVEHKEHITALRAHVDMLTMSATPIPRTLEMSLAGIREMSTITTPPEERHPILTYVGPFDDKLVGAAVRRELLREGQVFFVHNRVSDIDAVATRLREAVPEARVAIAHGQMNEELLEKVIDGFWARDYDVLLCTTIVETGLDISNANTLIVDHAEILGLSQMHQLRGRVGRGRERGYAYFLYPSEKPLTTTAHDRLSTIAQNSDLGSGMAVAMKDLEIRGAGSILGAEQSGHIAGVGFDLYIRLVGEAVNAFKKASGSQDAVEEEPLEVRVELPVDANLPHEYIPAERLRLDAYRRIASAATPADIDAVAAELVDRYGQFDDQVRNLLGVALLRQRCRAAGIGELSLGSAGLKISPIVLAESAQMRVGRLYPGSRYRELTHTLTLRPPLESDRIGAATLRDQALLDFCTQVVDDLAPAGAPVPVG